MDRIAVAKTARSMAVLCKKLLVSSKNLALLFLYFISLIMYCFRHLLLNSSSGYSIIRFTNF